MWGDNMSNVNNGSRLKNYLEDNPEKLNLISNILNSYDDSLGHNDNDVDIILEHIKKVCNEYGLIEDFFVDFGLDFVGMVNEFVWNIKE